MLEEVPLSTRQSFQSEISALAAWHQYNSHTAGECSVPRHHGLLLRRATCFKHTKINDTILSPARMWQHHYHHPAEAKTSVESVSREVFACTITLMLASLPSRQAALTHQAQVTKPSLEACWFGSTNKTPQLLDCRWLLASLKPWQNKCMPAATKHQHRSNGPKMGRWQSRDVSICCQY